MEEPCFDVMWLPTEISLPTDDFCGNGRAPLAFKRESSVVFRYTICLTVHTTYTAGHFIRFLSLTCHNPDVFKRMKTPG